MIIKNTIDYTVDPDNITSVGIERPSTTIVEFLKKYPWLGKNIQFVINKTNEARVLNLIDGLADIPNKLAKVFDKSNLTKLSEIIKTTNTSFIIKNFLSNTTDNIIDTINEGKIDIFFPKTKGLISKISGFCKNAVDSILNSSENKNPIINEAAEINNEASKNYNTTNYNTATGGKEVNYIVLNFQNKFKGLEKNLQFLIKHSSEDKVSQLISGLNFHPIRLANIIQQANLVNFSNILNNNNDFSTIIRDIKGNETKDIIYAIKNGKMPGVMTMAKGFFRNKILSFLDVSSENNYIKCT